MDRLIVALGNPGTEYEQTRHNIGWQCVEHLPFSRDLFWKEKFKGAFAQYSSNVGKVYFLKPMTFMNLSGESVQPLCAFFKITPDDILVVHDELDLPYGTIAFKNGGGLAGHKGLKSISEKLGTNDFKRLRLGIGRPERGSVSSFVLSGYSPDQLADFEDYMNLASEAIVEYLKNGFDGAARKYSKKSLRT